MFTTATAAPTTVLDDSVYPNKPFFAKLAFKGTTPYFEILPGQDHVLGNFDAGPNGSHMNLPYSKMGEYKAPPAGTIYIVTEYDLINSTTMIVGNLRPLYFGVSMWSTLLPKDNTNIIQDCEFYIAYLILRDNNESDALIKGCLELFDGFLFTVDERAIRQKLGSVIREEPKPEPVPVKGIVPKPFRRMSAPDVDADHFYVEPDQWDMFCRNVQRGKNTLIIGPTGSGKTEVLQHVAKAFNLPLHVVDMGSMLDPQSGLIGTHRMGSKGHSIFDEAPLVKYVREPGIILLDEINRAPLSAANILFPALDRRRYLPMDIAMGEEHSDRFVRIHEGVTFFATANVGSSYTATQEIDRALYDRFLILEVDYPKEAIEVNLLINRTGIGRHNAETIVKVANTIRQKSKKADLSSSVSVRHTLEIAELVAEGCFKLGRALEMVLLPLFEDDFDTTTSQRTAVNTILSGY